MLLAVEGGGFFSSSASGYSNGLTLLLFGRRNEERPMRVSPWNQYQLVEQELESDLQLASRKTRTSQGCTSFICFGRSSPGSCPSKLGSDSSSASERSNITSSDVVNENNREVSLKSNLKKRTTNCSVIAAEADAAHDSSEEGQNNRPCCAGRKVQWTDACGRELAEIREFEVSDEGASEDESENHGSRRCGCIIQ